ncbi:hypothetical protein HA402_013646 [Bradysia odoriphaga]|nr:hypothetical protein HA402_013646 [Bradysia odoriphaga]
MVSYHGTGNNNANSIAENGFLLSRGRNFVFGYGIYSTPDIAVALMYAKTFIHENEEYKFIVQNRVNPETVQRVTASKTRVGEYWICEKEEDIRPYGFCYMKC